MSDVTGHRNLHIFHIYIENMDLSFSVVKIFPENWLIYFKMIQKNAKSRKYLKNVGQTETNSTWYFHVSDSTANRKTGYDYSHQQLHLLVW